MKKNMMNHYEWVLFDADDTLFHFDAFGGLQRMFSNMGIHFTESDYDEFFISGKNLLELFLCINEVFSYGKGDYQWNSISKRC